MNYILTLLGRTITDEQLTLITQVIRKQHLIIDTVAHLAGQPVSNPAPAKSQANTCIEFSVRGEPNDLVALRAHFLAIANEFNIDIAFQEDNIYRRNRRLVVLDMDSTLIEVEVIDELAKLKGVGPEVSAITESAMRGEIDFCQSFRQRVALLKGLEESALAKLAKTLPLTEGAERLILTLKKLGYKTAIISGGFSYFGRYLQNKLGIDYVYANELNIEQGYITGEVALPIIDGEEKAKILQHIAMQEKISVEQVIAVGDGANDLPMLNMAGLGIAFRAKPMVKANAKQVISTLGLDGILYLLGVREQEILA